MRKDAATLYEEARTVYALATKQPWKASDEKDIRFYLAKYARSLRDRGDVEHHREVRLEEEAILKRAAPRTQVWRAL
jgi:hypothetical protein